MNPVVKEIGENGDIYTFTLSSTNVSIANALRRTILSDIPTLGFYTENLTSTDPNVGCNIIVNTSRLHNEIVKQRLSCVPLFKDDNIEEFSRNHVVEVDVSNQTENVVLVTTEDFRIRNKETGAYFDEAETHRIFPSSPKTNMYIDFVRLRPKIGDMIPGEQLKLVANISVHTAKENSVYNVVSICTYQNSPDRARQLEAWERQEEELSKTLTKEEVAFRRKNFEFLDAQRIYVPDSYDFTIQTIGVYENRKIVYMANQILVETFMEIVRLLEANSVPILVSENTIPNCYDVLLEGMDYTVGCVLEAILYTSYFKGDKSVSFVAFKKLHPHDENGTLRVAFSTAIDKGLVSSYIRNASLGAMDVFKKIQEYFQ